MFSIAFTLHGRNKLFLNRDEYHLLTTFIALFCHMWGSALSAKFGTSCIHGRNAITCKCFLYFFLINICCSFCATAILEPCSWEDLDFEHRNFCWGFCLRLVNLTADKVRETLVPFSLPSMLQRQSWNF